ncbi:hypothetical protein SPD48_10385 [Pseudogracilibacillus sp. SE30717A]|uniref:hypothetical protein n=1 Tax=Pseudogracilibacillus sp. SE30717A TaxID=3098293 RepID=UPI00300E1FF0
MKKSLLLLVSFLMLLIAVLSACGTNQEELSADVEEEKIVRIGYQKIVHLSF